jgi:hypothetical protein
VKRVAVLAGAVVVGVGLLTGALGLRPLGDGQLIDGQVVGEVMDCSSTDWIGEEVDLIIERWPDGHPAIRDICVHRPPSSDPVSLGNPRFVVINLADGRRIAQRFSGIGCAIDQAGTPQACTRYDPSMAASPG